ncbi:hypothetical protein [Bacillus sp. JJ722]|uniref:hypothetical protein n=1 Tax=Bacillus sp. JJ722 TaxID=3122973 RepID=UPI002FFF1667
MKSRNRILLTLICSLAILGVGLKGILSGSFSSTSLHVQYIFAICGLIGAISCGVELFKQRNV